MPGRIFSVHLALDSAFALHENSISPSPTSFDLSHGRAAQIIPTKRTKIARKPPGEIGKRCTNGEISGRETGTQLV
jgi:hypothetical protein